MDHHYHVDFSGTEYQHSGPDQCPHSNEESTVPNLQSSHTLQSVLATPVDKSSETFRKTYKIFLRCIIVSLFIVCMIAIFYDRGDYKDVKKVSRKLFEEFCYRPTIDWCRFHPLVLADKYQGKICNVRNRDTFCNGTAAKVFLDYTNEVMKERDECLVHRLKESHKFDAWISADPVSNDRRAPPWSNPEGEDDRNTQANLEARPCEEQSRLDRLCYNAQFTDYLLFCVHNGSRPTDPPGSSFAAFTLVFTALGLVWYFLQNL